MSTKQSPLTVVRMAQDHAKTELEEHGRIRPGVFMLVACNPQTGAALTQPAAIGTVVEEGFKDEEDQQEFLDGVRAEAKRLQAQAAAICVQAEAEVEGKDRALSVALIHIEDADGITLLHAPIERKNGRFSMGAFVAMEGAEAAAASGIQPPLLA